MNISGGGGGKRIQYVCMQVQSNKQYRFSIIIKARNKQLIKLLSYNQQITYN